MIRRDIHKTNLALNKLCWRVLAPGLLVAALIPPIALADETKESIVTTETQDFLSDRGRVGSIVGGILAGATLANPFAPLAGTVVGFFVGKHSDFTNDDDSAAARNRFANRSIIPTDTGSVGLLAVSSNGSDTSTPTLPVVAPGLTGGADLDVSVVSLSLDESDTGALEDIEAVEDIETVEDAEAQPEELQEVAASSEHDEVKDESEAKPEKSRPPAVNLIISKDVGGRQADLDRLAATIRAERDGSPFELNQQCPHQEASRIRKKVVVAGFNVENPDQAVFGGLGSVGYAASEWIYQNLLSTGEVLPLSAPGRQMFASLKAGPTQETFGNRLEQYSAVSRQMGAQFVVSGIIRNLSVNRADSWDSSYASSIKRSLFSSDTVREFVVDVVLHDGYTGRVVTEQRYTASGRWDIPRTGKVSFGSPEFNESDYGMAVAEVFDDITEDLMGTIDCQALLVPILEVTGKDLLLDIGTKSGLLPGDKLRVVRAESSLRRRNAPPKLWDTGVDLHLHQLSLDTSRAWMPADGSTINIRAGDYAVMY